MKPLSLSVRCTREEYMDFCAFCKKGPLWTTVAGAALIAVAAVLTWLAGAIDPLAMGLLFGGILLVLFSPLILPMLRKGEAGRRYDASDSLKGAVMLTLEEQTLRVTSACQEGQVPLDCLTEVIRTKAMLALVFSGELSVYIPLRSLSEEDVTAFNAVLAPYEKER